MTTTRLPKTITAGALLATPIPPVKWIINYPFYSNIHKEGIVLYSAT